MSSARRTVVLCAILVAALVAFAWADRDSAVYFADRGDKALRAREWADAEAEYRKSLGEDETFLPARHGLAEALLGADRRDEGVAELRRFIEEMERAPSPPGSWMALLGKARSRIAKIDATGAKLLEMEDAHVADLLKLARKWQKKDPDVAVKALRRVLLVRPGHEDAVALIEAMGFSPMGEPRSLFNGEDLSGWTDSAYPQWQVKDGELIAEQKDQAAAARTETVHGGNFDLRMEARFLVPNPGTSLFAVQGCYDGKDGAYTFGCIENKLIFKEDLEDGETREVGRYPVAGFDREKWNVYELRFRADTVTAVLNGVEIATDPRAEKRATGFVGILAQNCRFAVRRIEVVPR